MANPNEFGKYRLIAELGRGGMANVFLAVAEGPEGFGFTKLIVVKRLRRDLADDPEFVTMLVDEGRLAARLNHPNAVQTYEIGEVDGQYFIAMEYLEGQPLSRIDGRARRRRRAIPINYSLSILADVLSGLHHAHDLRDYDGSPLGVVHRDVTPQNVFVTYEGQVKLVDFGIAKAAGNAHETKYGVLKGKLVYMAPEQASLKDVDRRADIFSVGAMMWEVLTGERMWSGDEPTIMKRLVTGDMPGAPSSLNPDVNPRLDAICRKALMWHREERYSTAEEMAREIVAYLHERGERPVASDIGNLVGELFAEQRRETRELLEAQLSDLKNRSASTFRIRALSTASSGNYEAISSAKIALVAATDPLAEAVTRSSPRRELAAAATPDVVIADVPVERPRLGRAKTAFAVGALLLVGGAIAFTRVVARTAPARASSATSLSSVTLPNAARPSDAPAQISVRLGASAPSASFRIDDGAPVAAPYTARFPRDDGIHVIVASAPGHESERREVVFDADHVVTFDLHRRTTSRLAIPTKAPPPSPPSREAAPPRIAPPTAVPAPLAEGPPRPARAPKPIDEDNPYANQK